jgi:MoaA/NifB/PqqE/SkfB family radical SAM enzyme
VALTTNGTILNERRIESLFQSGLHLVDVSIDAFTPETYAAVRVNGKLATTRQNVLTLVRLRDQSHAPTRIVVSYVEQPLNMHETEDFRAYWTGQGVDAVVIRRLHSAAGGVIPIADVMRGRQQPEARRPCLYPWERVLLNPRGELAFCPQDWVHGSVLADYRTATIREVWQGAAYRRLREAHLTNRFSDHGFCGQCPDWQQTRWPSEGRSYADLVQDLALP